MKIKYEIESSQDGVRWRHEGGWEEGDSARHGGVMNAETSQAEALEFKEYHSGKKKHVRLVTYFISPSRGR